ncbi:MAG: hypothetical protein AUG44_26330 [Actinobacteria bacterium 13_1_20CM_3_71_11]|nr:MAG: hypothetical protein AUG44_26330 [Actinobacteria bacterium 13_1_20CM_3_71_11]
MRTRIRAARAERGHNRRVRAKIVALLVSLAALWSFAAFVTLREGVNLLWVTTLDTGVGKPTESLLSALQQERRLSLVYLGGHRFDQRGALTDQRARTDAAVTQFRTLVQGQDVQFAASAALRQRLTEALAKLSGLSRARTAIDNGGADRLEAAAAFTDIVDSGFRIYGSLATIDDPDIAKNVRTLIALSRAREVLSQEDTLMAGVLAAGHLTPSEYQRFVQLVGTQRFLYSEADTDLSPADHADYGRVQAGADAIRLRDLEDRVILRGTGGSAPVVDAASWDTVAVPLIGQLRGLELTGGQRVVAQATPAAVWVIVRLLLAGGLGLLAVIASVIMSITTARALIRQLERLRNAAWELANVRLPGVVERLGRGEPVDVAAEAPPLAFGSDEIGQVGAAFNAVQQTAVRVAVEQAELRRSVRDVFLNLARRTQALVHRQLTVLDTMERRETSAEGLENLFRVDHLATRMRRNAENLIVLSGAAPGRGWRHAVALVDVVRGAVAEVEEYTRVTVLPMTSAGIVGRAVGDIMHLLAELIENAVSFSPPYTVVQVGAQPVANGIAVEIEDRGLGMSEADRAAANEQLRQPPEFNMSSTAQLGLYVVGRLAVRHGIQVRLKDSPYGGTTAVILIPRTLVAEGHEVPAEPVEAELAEVGLAEVGLAEVGRGRHTELVRAHTGNGRGLVPPAALSAPPVPPPREDPEPPPGSAEPPGTTEVGLPRRVRQANLAGPLRADDVPAEVEPTPRGPEQVRTLMSAYQTGTRQGRADALHPDPIAHPPGEVGIARVADDQFPQ